jgi:hypothetical protein
MRPARGYHGEGVEALDLRKKREVKRFEHLGVTAWAARYRAA